MTSDLSGQIIKGRKGLGHWAGLFEEWRLLNAKICRLNNEDAPYWYNEMTNVSVLAGAAWRAGWISLSEIQSEKGAGSKNARWGRADLYIQNDFKYEYIEAKYATVNANSYDGVEEKIGSTLESAEADAKDTGGRDHYATGIAFIAPYWSAKQLEIRHRDKNYDFDLELEELVEKAIASVSQAVAWSFPAASRRLKDDSGAVWPGVFMFAKNVWIK